MNDTLRDAEFITRKVMKQGHTNVVRAVARWALVRVSDKTTPFTPHDRAIIAALKQCVPEAFKGVSTRNVGNRFMKGTNDEILATVICFLDNLESSGSVTSEIGKDIADLAEALRSVRDQLKEE